MLTQSIFLRNHGASDHAITLGLCLEQTSKSSHSPYFQIVFQLVLAFLNEMVIFKSYRKAEERCFLFNNLSHINLQVFKIGGKMLFFAALFWGM
jgi:hypothetical protein